MKSRNRTLMAEFRAVVQEILPVLCFDRDGTRAFLECAQASNIEVRLLDCGDGRRAFVGIRRNTLDFIIPGNWPERYAIVEQAVRQLKDEPERRHLRMDIDEGTPSHSAYFAGLLPGLGFEMEPRIAMTAEQAILDQIASPALPHGFLEAPFRPDRAGEFARVYHEAYLTHHPDWSPERRAEEATDWQRAIRAPVEDLIRLGIEHRGELVAACDCVPRGKTLGIVEIAVLPGHRRRGLGRGLLIRCMRELAAHAPSPESHFALGTVRTYGAAISLYRSLGFSTQKVYTRARWNRSPAGN